MPKCIVKGCQHHAGRKYSTPGVALHMFPKDFPTIKQWLLQTNQDFGDVDLFAQGIVQAKMGVPCICSAHFAPECYSSVGSQKILLEGSIPTIFPERDKPSDRMETAVSPVFQSIYSPIGLGTNNTSTVSNIALWGVNQVIDPEVKMNQDNDKVTNGLGVHISASAAEHKTEGRAHEHGNPITDFVKSLLPSLVNANFCAELTNAMPQERAKADTETGPMVSGLSTEKADKAIQWPEYENNVDGETWKVLHDHVYMVPHSTEDEDVNQSSSLMQYMSKDDSPGYFEGDPLESELFSMLQYVASMFAVNKKKKDLKTARVLNQALEILSLVTEEEWVIVNKNSIHKGVHQLTGEFPVKCGDVAVFFTMDEWSYLERHKQEYRDFVTDSVPMNRTWEVPQHWNSDPMTEYEEEEEEEEEVEESEDFPIKESSSDWEPDSDGLSEEETAEEPEKLSSDEQQITHKCDKCEESFPDEEALEAHKLTHKEKCEDCEEEFTYKAELIKHRAENHAVKRFACTICGIQYDYKSQFVIHQRAHTGEKPFECDECGAKFGHRSTLLVHQRRHREGKTFKCSKCIRCFDKRCEMVRHEKIHDKEKPLVKQENVLDKKKPYKCKKCGKTFKQKAAHERHKWDHDDL